MQILIKYTGLILCFFLMQLNSGLAQDEVLEYIDKTYVDHIHTVRLADISNPFGEPILLFNSGQRLQLSFDDFSEDTRSYVYTVVHCNADWTPSDLTELDYMDGFTEGEIEEYDFSINTLTPYTNYTLMIPNEEISWSKSGNYLLKVYDIEDERELVLTRRFVVFERVMPVNARFLASSSSFDTHQEISFDIVLNGMRVDNPTREITVVVQQNRRWDNAIYAHKPRYERKEKLVYDTRDQFSFGAGKEFRYLDLRSVERRQHSISEIIREQDGYQITLFSDEPRSDKSFLRQPDMNGRFVIENADQQSNSDNVRADYANVLFSLKYNQELADHDVYLVGDFNNWYPDARYKMVYNNLIHSYVAKPKLKQGVYDYMYAVLPKSGGTKMALSELEGHWYETENDYRILVYYRPFGARYDRLVAVQPINTVKQNNVNSR